MFKTIPVPTDGSALLDQAVNIAIEFAKINSSKVIGLSLTEPYFFQRYPKALSQQTPPPMEKKCESCILQKLPTPQKNNCDVIFMSSHGHKGLNKLLVGSETQKVLAHSTTLYWHFAKISTRELELLSNVRQAFQLSEACCHNKPADYRMISTGAVVAAITLVATEPIISPLNAPCPCEPMTIMSIVF